RALGSIENPQDLQSLKPIGADWGALADAIEEMAAFLDEGLAFGERDWHCSRPIGNRDLIAPFDRVRKELQFLTPALTVVEHGHGPVADEYQLLLLEGMQPRHKDMGIDAVGKAQMRGCHIGDSTMQVASSRRPDFICQVGRHRQDHRNIGRGKAREKILLAPTLAERERIRIDVEQSAERARSGQFLELEKAGMILQQVADHQDATLRLGERAQLLRFTEVERERLLDENMLAGIEPAPNQMT